MNNTYVSVKLEFQGLVIFNYILNVDELAYLVIVIITGFSTEFIGRKRVCFKHFILTFPFYI